MHLNPPNIPLPECPLGAWEMLSSLLPAIDLTREAQNGLIVSAFDPWQSREESITQETDCYDHIYRFLFRQQGNNLLLTGDKGVGKTTVVKELARRSAVGEIPFLAAKRFLWIDCRNVGVEDSRGCLESLLAIVDESEDVILCIDGLGSLLKRTNGGSNKPLLRALASRESVQIIGILSNWEYVDQIGSDALMLEQFSRVVIEEPDEETTLQIVHQSAQILERQYELKISKETVTRTVVLTSNFLLSEHQPAKSIKVLRHLCDEARYESSELKIPRVEITSDDLIKAISQKTGLPEETISGESGDGNFETSLSERIVGQDTAVNAVAAELRLIKSGLTEPEKPASVLLFAGMTGVGKTELAKRFAELYSTSGRLQTYSMGNFTEPHSVSGIIGVPPGYVGHEEGGRLINELNADPYSVFLLDEAEKCHPNVWKPFLHLFDEGWIHDQKGVKAHADRAVFILTTNAGENVIAQMTKSGKPESEIVQRVQATLSNIRQERSQEPVFSTQFIARFKRIVVFRPLDEDAMIGIARKKNLEMQKLWSKKREKTIEVNGELVDYLGRVGHARNTQAKGKEGGRIVRRLLADTIEDAIQQQAAVDIDQYKQCVTVCVKTEDSTTQRDVKDFEKLKLLISFE